MNSSCLRPCLGTDHSLFSFSFLPLFTVSFLFRRGLVFVLPVEGEISVGCCWFGDVWSRGDLGLVCWIGGEGSWTMGVRAC